MDTKRSKGLTDVLVAKLNSSGLPIWLESGGGTYIDGGNSILVDSNSKIYLIGYCSKVAKFWASEINALGSENLFLARIQE